jgi:hypothetical protein
MRPCDPTAVAKRFAAVFARGVERADRETAEHFARIRALPTDEEAAERPPWVDEPSPGASGCRSTMTSTGRSRRRARRTRLRRSAEPAAVPGEPLDESR